MQLVNLGLVKASLPRLQDSARAMLKPIGWWVISFNFETRTAIGQQHETRGPCDGLRSGLSDDILSLLR